jgi:hypothetical protein
VFSRRTIQTLLDGLNSHLSEADVAELVRRLNTPRARIAATWEIAVCYGLSKIGGISFQTPLPSGKRPDVVFSIPDMISFVADVTTLSDDGYQDIEGFSDDFVSLVRKTGLDPNKFHTNIGAERIGHKVRLRIPEPSRRLEMLRTHLVPFLREIKQGGDDKVSRTFSEPDLGLTVSYDRQQRYMGSNYRSFNQARSVDQNPLRRRLAVKASQLKGAEGLAGVIVCDGGSSLLSGGAGRDMDAFSADDIIKQFLRSTSSVDFVFAITSRRGFGARADCSFEGRSWTLDPTAKPLIDKIMRSMLTKLPQPIYDAANAARQAEQKDTRFGTRADTSYSTDGEKIMSIGISARHLLEILAGKHSPADIDTICGEPYEDVPGFPNPFKQVLARGQLIKEIKIEPITGKDDDEITIIFGEPDPAAAPFRASTSKRPGK